METLHLSASGLLSTSTLKEPLFSRSSFTWHSSLDCLRDITLLWPLLYCLRGWASRRHNP